MQLLLIRHSITAGNLEHRYIGCRTDEPLCEAGIALAQQKSVEFRRSFPAPELVLVSPMQRCRQTAEILFPHMPQKIVWGLQECDFGAFEGKNYQELSGDTSYQSWIDRYFFDLSMIIRFYVYKISVLPSIRYWWKASGIPQMDRRLASATSYW